MYPHSKIFHFTDPRCQVNNYARVQWLLTEQGTFRLKQFIFNNLPDGLTFEETLKRNENKFRLFVQKKIISKSQFTKLFPVNGLLNIGKIDLSLAYALARNITTKKGFNWQYFERNPPKESHQQEEHHVVRLRNARNILSHIQTAMLEQHHFQTLWKDIETALIGLHEQKKVIDDFLNLDLDPMHKLSMSKPPSASEDQWQVDLHNNSGSKSLVEIGIKTHGTVRHFYPQKIKIIAFVVWALTMVYVLSNLLDIKWTDGSLQENWKYNQVLGFIVLLAVICGLLFYFVFIRSTRRLDNLVTSEEKALLLSESEMSHSPNMKTMSICTDAGIMHVMPRKEWGAKPSDGTMELLQAPAEYVIISHTADIGRFETTAECTEAVRNVQQIGFDVGFNDIAYNYLIGNDGVIYEGRGWTYVSATAKGWNRNSIGIGFIGKFNEKLPSIDAIDACKSFLQYMVDQGILKSDFTIYGLCQVRAKFPDAPGTLFFKDIQSWKGKGKNNTWSWKEKDPPEN